MKSLLHLVKYLIPFLSEILLSVLLGIATITAGVGMLGTSAFLIASAALYPSIAELQIAIVGVRFFGISRGVFRYLERLVSHSVNLKVLSNLRTGFYKQIEPGAPANIQSSRGGDLLDRAMGDLETLENFYVRVVSPLIVSIVVIVGISLFVGQFLPELGVILACGLVITGFILPGLSLLVMNPMTRKQTEVRAALSAEMVEMLQGLQDLHAYDAQHRWFEKINNLNDNAAKVQNRVTFLSGINSGIALLATNFTVLAVLMAATLAVSDHAMSGVTLAVVTLLAIASFEAVASLPGAAQNLSASLQSAYRLFRIGDGQPKPHHDLEQISTSEINTFDMQNVRFAYNPENGWVLDDLSLQLKKGRKVAIVGASGAGKTSIINLALRFWQPSDGNLTLNGLDVHSMDDDFVRSCFTIIDQKPFLFSASLRDNMLLAKPGASDSQIENALAQVGMSAWLQRLPEGLDTWLGENGVRISGGERQRLALGRAVLAANPFILLDEPTANIDAISDRSIMDHFFSLFADRGILLISHRLNQLEKMDEVILIDKGRVVERGSVAELISLNGKFNALLEVQKDLLWNEAG